MIQDKIASIASDQLKAVIERIERLEAEKGDIADHISEAFTEAKGNGYDPKILKKVIAMRRKTPSERQEEEAILDVYLNALNMLP